MWHVLGVADNERRQIDPRKKLGIHLIINHSAERLKVILRVQIKHAFEET